jgi:hypothetical protein
MALNYTPVCSLAQYARSRTGSVRFTKLSQAEQWLMWQIEDLAVQYPERK